MGVAPASPGMPDRHSSPARSAATQDATTVSHSSPAATVSVTGVPGSGRPGPASSGLARSSPASPGPVIRWMPLVATWMTVPGKPLSEISRLLPPPSTSKGSLCWSASRTAAMISSSVPATTKRRAGPPRPRVVKRDSLTGSRTLAMAASGQPDHRAGPGEHLVPGRPGGEGHHDPVAVQFLLDGAADLNGHEAIVVGHDHRGREPDAEFSHGPRIAGPVRDVARRLGHGEHAVRDDVGQPHRPGDPLVPVDDVEVTGRAAVLDQVQPGYGVAGRGKLGARFDVRVLDCHAHSASPAVPRSTSVEKAVHTCSPATVATSVRVVITVLRPRVLMVSMVDCAVTTSPARSGRA